MLNTQGTEQLAKNNESAIRSASYWILIVQIDRTVIMIDSLLKAKVSMSPSFLLFLILTVYWLP